MTVNFSQFGGGTAVSATNSSGTWTATYMITAGYIYSTTANVAVTATDFVGNTKTTTGTNNVIVLAASLSQSTLAITQTSIQVGSTATVTLTARDAGGTRRSTAACPSPSRWTAAPAPARSAP